MASSHGERSSTIGVDSICDEFEAAWLAGREPRIEAFLARGEALDQNLLLRELLLAEWDLCRRHDRPIELAPYLERFAASQPAINDLWSAFWRERQPDSGRDQGATIGFIPPKEIAFSEAPGTVIDRFKLLEKLGEGGFGTVWAAEQREPVKRRVALKIIKLGMDTRQVVARFEAERQALALMDHANIAKVFDAGATETGRPYFVMELVRGIPITEYCDQERLTAQARLDLVVKVCHAIQHAHQKGIIHRDIKPSNILVTLHDGVPVPKVIDFGIAKAVQQDLTEKTIYTQLAQFIGTPAYMSPEQAEMSGLDIDTRSDIYSLGVLLYELLTGVTPFDAKELLRSGLDEMRKIIREQEPLTPSTRLTKAVENAKKSGVTNSAPPGTSRMPHLAIDRDLDLIVMKCLEKDRTRRYETANSLAGDIGRYLRDEPVEACPPSTVYRFRKFIRRQKTGLMIATVLTAALLVVLGVVAGSIGWAVRDRATRQAAIDMEVDVALKEATRLQAQRKYADALAALPTKSRLSGSSQELQQRAGALRKELQMVLRLESLPLEGARTTSDGGFNFALEDSEYEKAFRQFGIDASALSPQEIADRVSATMIRLELASELDNWVFTRSFVRPQGDELAKKLMAATRLADPDKLRNRIRDAQETHDAKALNDLLSAENDELLQWPTWRLFYAALYQMKQWEQLMTLSHRLRRQRPEDFWNNFMLGSLYANWEPPQWEESARFYTAALSLNPENAAARNDLAWLLVNWPDPGVDHFEEAVDLAKKAVQSTPTAGKYRVTLGVAHYRAGQWSDALSAFQEATKLQKGGDSLVWFYLAMVHWQLGDKEQARKWYDQALQRLELYDPETRELKSTRAEAAKLLGIKEREPSNNWFKQLLKHSVTQ